MKALLFILFLSFGVTSIAQNDVVYQFGDVTFMTSVPGAGQKKVERLARLISNYISSIENDKYDDWYASFSDSTISRVAPHKFPNKFRRMKEYKMHGDSIKVISVKRLSSPFENEVGTEYELVLDLGGKLNVANRVSFDHVKRSDDNLNMRLVGINIIASDKGYEMIIHKYGSAKEGNRRD